MITYGFAKDNYYTGDGILRIKVRIPSIHGAYLQSDYQGKTIRNYTLDEDLPYYQSILLPYIPKEGEIVALSSLDESNSEFIVIGITGASYSSNKLI